MNHLLLRMYVFMMILGFWLMPLRAGLYSQEANLLSNPVVVSGVVIDADNHALPGVNVIIKGSAIGTITGVDGAYSLQAPDEDAVIVFSFLGFVTQEIVVGSQRIINVVLIEDASELDEMVVVGYGTSRRRDLTSSVSHIGARDFNVGAHVSVMQAIQGKVPGLSISRDGNPNGNMSVLLRGASTLRTGDAQQPLYVIDGIPGGMLSSLDDVVSIDVLRDASAAAIYGARAANGVIIVTTRRGEENSSKISYSGYVGLEVISNKIEMMSASEYRNFLSSHGLQPVDDDNVDRDWQSELTRVGITHNNHLAVSGGSSRTTYFASAAYKSIDGIILETGRNTMSFMANVQQKAIQERLTVGLTVNAAVTNGRTYPQIDGDDREFLYSMLHFWPTVVDNNPDGTPKENLLRGSKNPKNLHDNNRNTFSSKNMRFTGNLQLRLLEGWDVNAYGSYGYNQNNNNAYNGKFSRLAQDRNGLAVRNTAMSDMKVIELYTTYSQRLAEHDFRLMLGYSWQEDVTGDGFQTANSNFVSDAIGYNNLALGSGFEGMVVPYGNYGVNTLRLISTYFRLNYAYKDKYLLQGTLRRDGSSAFGPNNRWGYFPSISAGWRITEESFMASQNIFSNLKLRASYGISGNSLGFDPLLWRLRYSSAPNDPGFFHDGGFIRPIRPTQNENPDLKWESTSMVNLGIDFAVLRGRVSGTIEWYDKVTEGLIWSYPVPATQYFVNSFTANVGEMQNTGWEITLNAVPVQTSDIFWRSSFNISFNKNNINSLSNDEFKLDYIRTATGVGAHGQSGNYAQIIQEGYPIGQFYLWEYTGRNEEGISQFYDRDGNLTTTPSSEDHHHQGNAQPKAIFGWHNSVGYKGLTLDFLFRGVTGNQILNVTRADLNYPIEATWRNLHKMTLDEPINDRNAAFISSRYLEKGDYIRLDHVTLSYQVRLNSDEYIKSLRVYASVNNAFIFTKYKGLDPEVNLGGLTPGLDSGNFYPKTRSFMVGVNVDF